ncbi:MAG TPA: hypothetical protein PLB78_18355 [Anaerolineae bacterium]|nr:hypothetical protein [Anaerolineae bacterium]
MLPVHFPSVDTDAFVLMPNHVHAIVVIGEPEEVGAGFPRPASDARPGADVGPIGEGHAVGAGSPRPVPAGSPGPASDAGRHGDAGLDGGAFAEANGGATAEVGGGETPPLRAVGVFVGKPTLGQIVGYFKQQSTKHINALWGSPGEPMWQRNYYECIVRDAAELKRLRWYIEENPERWEEDRENPACRSAKAGR